MTTTPPQAPAPPDTVTVSELEHVAKQAVQVIPEAQLRADAWSAFTAALSAAKAAAPSRMPWQPADTMTEVSWSHGTGALLAVLDVARRASAGHYRTVKATIQHAARQYEATHTPDSKPRRGTERVCARPGCGKHFWSSQPTARSCSPACRNALFKARQSAQGNEVTA